MKRVRKIIPVSLYDIPGLEQWLEEQAGLGLFPVHLGSWATFERRGIPGTRFRLDVFANRSGEGTEPTPEKLELFRQAGWEYAFPIGRAYFLLYATDPQATELYTDYESRGLSLERLAKQIRRSKCVRTVLLALLILLFLAALFWPASQFDVQPNRWVWLPVVLLYLGNPIFPFLLALSLFNRAIDRRNRRTMLDTYQNLKEGLPPPPSPGPSRRIVRENIFSLALTPVLLLLVIVTWKIDRPVPLDQFHAPYLSVGEIEAEPMTTYEELFGMRDSFSEKENQGVTHFSLLAPVWYEVDQRAYSFQPGSQSNAFSPHPEGGRYRYTPDLEAVYFHLTIPAMARSVAEAQMNVFRLINLRWSYEEVEWPGTDFVILATEPDGIWQMAAVGHGGRVVVYRYGGVENLADHLEELVQMLLP